MEAVVHGIAFDLDGTLTDSITACSVALNAGLAHIGIPTLTDEDAARIVGLPLAVSVPPLLAAADAPTDRVVDVIQEYRRVYPEASKEHARLFPGTLDLLEQFAHRAELAVVTSKATMTAVAVLEQFNIEHYFADVIGSDQTQPKPSPEPLQRFLSRSGITVDQATVVGDATVDMQMAGAAGAFAIGVSWGADSTEDLMASGAAAVAHSVGELAQLLHDRASLAGHALGSGTDAR